MFLRHIKMYVSSFSLSVSSVLSGDGAEEGRQDHEVKMAEARVLPVPYSRADQTLQMRGIARGVRMLR